MWIVLRYSLHYRLHFAVIKAFEGMLKAIDEQVPSRNDSKGSVNYLVKFSLENDQFRLSNKKMNPSLSYLISCNYLGDNMAHDSTQKTVFVCQMEIHPLWRIYLIQQLLNSRPFRVRFCSWLIEMLKKTRGQRCNSVKLCQHCRLALTASPKNSMKNVMMRINMKLGSSEDSLHNLEPEIRCARHLKIFFERNTACADVITRSIKVIPQMLQQLQLEAVFAWLSTLGGAHSALGDYFSKNAEIAWLLSVKQLFIALKMGDPVLASHCRLFMSISLMQRGCVSEASKIIRSVRCMIKNSKRLQEKKLINCCKAAQVRLKFIRHQQRESRSGVHS